MELSSFQLMGIEAFKPQIAVITNIYEAHLDYHKTRENYVAAKWSIQENMTADDYLVLNWNSEELQKNEQANEGSSCSFFNERKIENGAYFLHGGLYYKEEKIMDASELGVPGAHNIENAWRRLRWRS